MTDDLHDVVLSLMEALDCPRALTVAILWRYGEWDQLTSLEVNPTCYIHAGGYAAAAAATSFLKKFKDFSLPIDREQVAIEKWFWAERECFRTNRRLAPYLMSGNSPLSDDDGRILSFLERVRKNVRSVLGSRPRDAFDGKFGPGATVSDKSTHVTVADKISSTPTFTPGALFFLVPWTGTEWAKASAALGRKPQSVRGNIFFSVFKNARAERPCGKEPSINGYYQLGLGTMMRERLKAVGIDLKDGQTVHKRVACNASKTGEFATIDLSSASDTLAAVLVDLLFPTAWADALKALRSPTTRLNGREYFLEKFSSMGNGFTFELETTVFLAVAMACVPQGIPGHDVFVYGDDIIVPSAYSGEVIAALKFLGFTPNLSKTFVEGNFRESCGGDYFNGHDVRPVYLTEAPIAPNEWITLANKIRRLMENPLYDRDGLKRVWFRVLDRIPVHIRRCRGPSALGDICIHDDISEWNIRVTNGIRRIRVWQPSKYREVRFDGFAYVAQFAAALYGIHLHRPGRGGRQSPDGDDRVFRPRDAVIGHSVAWVPYS